MKNDIFKLAIYTLNVAIMRSGWFAVIPFLTIYIHNNATKDPLIIGLIIGSGWFAACIGGLFGGVLADKYSSKSIMILSLILSSISLFIYTIVPPKELFLLLSLNSAIGLFVSFFEIGSKTYISRNFVDKQKIHAFSFRYTAINIGAAIGPFVGAKFISYDPKVVFIFTALLYLLVAILIGFIFIKDSLRIEIITPKKHKGVLTILMKDKILQMLTMLYFLFFMALIQIETSLPQIMSTRINHYTEFYARLLSLNAIIVICAQLPFSLILYKINRALLSYIAALMFAAAFVLLAFAKENVIFIIAITIFALAEVIYSTLINLFIDSISSTQSQGTYFGIANLGMFGMFLGPIVGGIALKYANGTILYLILASLLLFSSLVFRKLNGLMR